MRFSAILLLVVSLSVGWLALSGFLDHGLLLSLGAVSVVGVTALCVRLKLPEPGIGLSRLRPLRLLAYLPWLTKEVVVSNIDVIKRILRPQPDISPCMVELKTGAASDLNQTIFANSITLTPGTLSIDVGDEFIQVHCLSQEGAASFEDQEMQRRVRALERELH